MMPWITVDTYRIAADKFLKTDVRISGLEAKYSIYTVKAIMPAAQTMSGTSVRQLSQGSVSVYEVSVCLTCNFYIGVYVHCTPPQVTGMRKPVVEARNSTMPNQSTSLSLAKKAPCF